MYHIEFDNAEHPSRDGIRPPIMVWFIVMTDKGIYGTDCPIGYFNCSELCPQLYRSCNASKKLH